MEDEDVVGLVSVNSLDYVRLLLSNLERGVASVVLRNANDLGRAAQTRAREIVTPETGAGWLQRPVALPSSDRLAQIAFTSGTEGEPKGVLLTQRNLADAVRRLTEAMGLDASVREYVGSPATYSFGYGRFRAVLSAGGAAYLPPRGFDPTEISAMLRDRQINAISAVPTMWRLLLGAPHLIGERGRDVRWIEIGSQYMAAGEKEAMRDLFPNAVIIQHYGLTEASRTTFLRVHEAGVEQLESVGQPTGSVEVKVALDGRIAIRGPHVAAGYLIGGVRRPIADGDGWFQTSDLGQVDNGYVTYLGRADDVINCGGVKVSPEALESSLLPALGIDGGLAVCRMQDPLRGDGFLVAVKRNLGLEAPVVEHQVDVALARLGINAAASVRVVEVDDLPRTATGKVQRRALAEAYAKPVEPTKPLVPPRWTFVDLRELTLARNQLITLLISGLWHGPAWTFISWGAFHGVMLVAQRQLGRVFRGVRWESWAWRAFSIPAQIILVFILVTFSRILFRANDLGDAATVVGNIARGPYDWDGLGGKATIAICFAIIAVVLAAEAAVEAGIWRRRVARSRVLRTGLALIVLLATVAIGEFQGGRFIYVQF